MTPSGPGSGADDENGGRLAVNLMRFARSLRAAGLPVGPGRVLDAIAAVQAVGVRSRDDLYWTLHAVFVNRRDQREVFDQAFHVFWGNPAILERMRSLEIPSDITSAPEKTRPLNRRVAEATRGLNRGEPPPGDRPQEDRLEKDATLTWSDREVLGRTDFEQMSAGELAEAKQAVRRLRLSVAEVPTRRFRSDARGRRVDMRRTLRSVLRSGHGGIPLEMQIRRRRQPPLVVLCDISGSMNRYSRILLHFLHAVTNDQDRVHTFLFGTRLTNVSRQLRHRDVDVALERVAESVPDWSGGTRIGSILHEFNRDWARRVLGQGAVVLFITDGLDRDAGQGLPKEMERLRKSCRRLIWLNPMLRYEGFQPKALGNRAIMPHVDEFRPVHNLESIEALARALAGSATDAAADMTRWRRAARAADAAVATAG